MKPGVPYYVSFKFSTVPSNGDAQLGMVYGQSVATLRAPSCFDKLVADHGLPKVRIQSQADDSGSLRLR
jgi:hypothetical protein